MSSGVMRAYRVLGSFSLATAFLFSASQLVADPYGDPLCENNSGACVDTGCRIQCLPERGNCVWFDPGPYGDDDCYCCCVARPLSA
jgi:hypothetical protein